MLTRYCDDEFDPDSSAATIGIDFKFKTLIVRGEAYRLTLFDTAGQERFRTLSTSFYRGAHGVLLVYDISSKGSFQTMEKWFLEAETYTVEGAALFLVGAKLDKAEENREVTPEEGRALAEAHGARFCEASAKTRENVRSPFIDIVDEIVSTPGLLARAKTGRSMGTIAMSRSGNAGYGAYFSGCSC